MAEPKPKRKPKRSAGFVCSACGVPTQVTCVRAVSELIVRRYRQCPRCERKAVTEERPTATVPPAANP